MPIELFAYHQNITLCTVQSEQVSMIMDRIIGLSAERKLRSINAATTWILTN